MPSVQIIWPPHLKYVKWIMTRKATFACRNAMYNETRGDRLQPKKSTMKLTLQERFPEGKRRK